MLHGKGIGYEEESQAFLTKSYLKKRRVGLRDKNSLTSEELILYEISGADGGGRTNEKTYQMKQFPFPTKGKETIDIRKDPRIGD